MTFLPLWMEILVNVIGYAGFIGIATWHKSSDEITTELSPAWSFEAVTTPGQGSTHLTIDHFGARSQNRTLATVTARPADRDTDVCTVPLMLLNAGACRFVLSLAHLLGLEHDMVEVHKALLRLTVQKQS